MCMHVCGHVQLTLLHGTIFCKFFVLNDALKTKT